MTNGLDSFWHGLKLEHAPNYVGNLTATVAEPERKDYRRAVVGGEIQFLSITAIEMFDPGQDGGCNRKWNFRYVQGIKRPENARGVDIHKQIKHYLQTGEDVLSPVVRIGKHLMPSRGDDLIVEFEFNEDDRRLLADGVPLRGAIDCAQSRGSYIDTTGELIAERSRVAEVIDWKSTASIADYAKLGPNLINTIQMPGYGVIVADADPALDHVRLSHVYFQTRGKKMSEKRTALFEVATVKRAWEDTERIVRAMKQVAREPDALRVDPNWDACSAYGGCFYRDRCPRSARQAIIDLIGKDKAMTLAKRGAAQLQAVPAGASPALPLGMSPELAAEMARLRDLEARMQAGHPPPVAVAAAPPAIVAYGFCAGCGVPVNSANASKLATGAIVHIGCTAAPAQVVPPDAPRSTPATAAIPVPQETLPTLHPAVAEAARQQAAAHAAHVAATTPSAAGPPPAAPASRGRGRRGTAATPPASNPEPANTADQDALGIVLLVDVVGRGMGEVKDLIPYIDQTCDALAAQFQAADIRCAPADSALGFGKWKGALCAAVRDTPPEPGTYRINFVGDSEIYQVVVEALAPLAATYIRGVR